jgi:outer membrane protein assembly factor BamE
LLISLSAVVLNLSACSRLIYRIDVQQGNVVTQDMLAQLHAGMEKDKVRFIMGSPLLVDVFHQNRWDYIYSMQPAGGKREQRQVSLYFNNEDKLARISGDIKTANHPLQPPQRRDESVAVPDLEEKKSLWARMFGGDSDKDKGKGETALALRKPGAKPDNKSGKTTASSGKKGVLGGIFGGRSPRAPESSEGGGGGSSTSGGLNTN